MKNLLFNYILKNFLKTFFLCVLITYSFGMILNLFEEIEFFKNLDVSIFTPLMLTSLHIPGMLIQLFPFIIFITSMKFILDLKNKKSKIIFDLNLIIFLYYLLQL